MERETVPFTLTEENMYMTGIVEKGKKPEGSVTIPKTFESDGVQYEVVAIGDYAFHDCPNLRHVTIPDSVVSICRGAFTRCGLTSIMEEGSIPDSAVDMWEETLCAHSSPKGIVIPDSVRDIGENAFAGCSYLKSITIPDSVTEIGEGAFSGCLCLESINIPDSVAYIRPCTFKECRSLTDVTIPCSVKKIGTEAFHMCSSLAEVTIPESTRIKNRAFDDTTAIKRPGQEEQEEEEEDYEK